MRYKRFSLRYWVNVTVLILLSLALTYFLISIYSDLYWARLIHPPRYIPNEQFLKERDIPYRDVEFTSKDGTILSAWYIPPKNGAVILIAHGLSVNRAATPYFIFADHGYGVLTWDSRAHGKSGGESVTFGDLEQLDTEAALDFALAQPGVEHVGAWGGSMGAWSTLLVAERRTELEAVISEGGSADISWLTSARFTQPLAACIGKQITGLDINRIIANVRPIDKIADISPRAVFIIDGEIPAPHSLYNAAQEPKQIWTEKGVPHMGMASFYPQQYEENLIAFFDRYLLGK
jgi:dienelactone hydrolase